MKSKLGPELSLGRGLRIKLLCIRKNLDYFQGAECRKRLTVLGTKKRVVKWKSRCLGLRSKTCQSGGRLKLTAVTVLFKMSVFGFKLFPI